MNHVERISRELSYKGAIVDFYTDTMRLPDGKIEKWDLVHHRRGAACVIPVLDDGRILMIRQFRPALDRMTLEPPAGARDSETEDTRVCAIRELREETGYDAKNVELLIKLRPTVAYCDEFIDVYVATGLTKAGNQILDEAEAIEIEAFTIEELLNKIFNYEIQDSKAVSAILAYKEKYLR